MKNEEKLNKIKINLNENEKDLNAFLNEVFLSNNKRKIDLSHLHVLENQFEEFNENFNDSFKEIRNLNGSLKNFKLIDVRLQSSLNLVKDTSNLKANLQLISDNIHYKNYDLAALKVKECLSIPRNVIESEFADKVIPSTDSPSTPSITLEGYINDLNDIFSRNFASATESFNQLEISRYFKLFSLIHQYDNGIRLYSIFIINLINSRFNNNDDSHLISINRYLELILNVIDGHAPVILKYYGEVYMSNVIKSLIEVIDNRFKVTYTNWLNENKSNLQEKDNLSIMNTHINEIISFTSNWFNFKSFIIDSYSSYKLTFIEILDTSLINKTVNESLLLYYENLELTYFNKTINFVLTSPETEIETEGQPYTSSTLDDSFYILNIVIGRLLKSSNNTEFLNNISDKLIKIFKSLYIDTYLRDFNNNLNGILKRHNKVIFKENDKQFIYLIVSINNLDLSVNYTLNLVSNYINSNIQKETIIKFKQISDYARSSTNACIDKLFIQIFKNRISEILLECCKHTTYNQNLQINDGGEFIKKFKNKFNSLLQFFKPSLSSSNYTNLLMKCIGHLVQSWETLIFKMKFTNVSEIANCIENIFKLMLY